jgi:uncharacterized protein (DUF736 family)
VTKHDDGHYDGELETLSVRADITIMPVTDKAANNQPDFRVLSKRVEISSGSYAPFGLPPAPPR